ncbi:MAG TPA: DUF4249 domain-containing protein [Flavisolibacter sp.]|nr:DUF4249 domain-containing protein [Flavisolibacter sp.]
MKKFLVLAGIVLMGCEKKIDFKLHDQPDKLVVEGIIENDQPPVVILSKSVGYFSKISADILNNSFVHGAEVFVSNGTLTHKLKEYSRSLGSNVSLYYYSIDSSNLSTAFVGQLNHQYSLRIVSEGKEYTATTTIPGLTKKIDSVWWKKPPVTSDSTKVIVMVRVTDPPGFGDYIRYYTKTNREPFYPPMNSTFDDYFIDGTTYEIQVDKGVDRNLGIDFDENFFRRGDTVGLKLSNIDKATYDFWRTMEFSYSSVGDPFSSPTKVLGNIKGDALGYFGGYASQYRTIIIPH